MRLAWQSLRTLAQHLTVKAFIVDHWTYVFLGDGCLMEGISHEACSFAGTLGLGKLIAFWDDNGISIDGPVKTWFNDDTPMRFESYGWQVIRGIDGHESKAIQSAIDAARANTQQPTLICCKTIIGFGAPNLQGKEKCHGSALGESEVQAAREQLGWQYPPFVIPSDIQTAWNACDRGHDLKRHGKPCLINTKRKYPQLAKEFAAINKCYQKPGPAISMPCVIALKSRQSNTTRKASQVVLQNIGDLLPELLGGSADLI